MLGLLWLLVGVFTISLLFIITFAHLGDPPKKVRRRAPLSPYLARFRVTQALKKERERRGRKIHPFRFMDLPHEMKLAVLSHSSRADKASRVAFLSLLSVSKAVRHMTFLACLPCLRIKLTTRREVLSFHAFCTNYYPHFAQLVHHLWISPLNKEEEYPSCRILQSCVNIRSLACSHRLLAVSICLGRELKHRECRNFTLLASGPEWEYALPEKAGAAFMSQLTHLRVVCDTNAVPKRFPCKSLTHLSFPCANGGESRSLSEAIIAEVMDRRTENYPRLRTIVATVWEKSEERREPVREAGGSGVLRVAYYVPGDTKEVDIWCGDVVEHDGGM